MLAKIVTYNSQNYAGRFLVCDLKVILAILLNDYDCAKLVAYISQNYAGTFPVGDLKVISAILVIC